MVYKGERSQVKAVNMAGAGGLLQQLGNIFVNHALTFGIGAAVIAVYALLRKLGLLYTWFHKVHFLLTSKIVGKCSLKCWLTLFAMDEDSDASF